MTQPGFSASKAERYALWVDYLLIIVMLVCASISMVQFIQRIYTGWDASYVIFLVIVILIERLVTFKKIQSLELEQKIIYHAAEFVTFAILLKLFGYFLHGFGGFIDDLSRWQGDFLTFFTGEYFFVLILLFISWLLCGKFMEYLEEMRIDPLDVNWDVGILENRRQLARSAMISLIISVGVGMVSASILTRLDITALFGESPTLQLPVINILVYFLAAFLFFSQTQFALLNGRWMWHDVQIRPGLEKSWFKIGVFFLLAVSILSFILPTSYTVSILDLLRIVFTFITQILFFIFSLLFLPIGWLFSLLKGSPPTAEVSQSPDFTSLIPPAATQQVPPFLLLLQSLLFWTIFIGLIVLSFSIYFRQNKLHLSLGKVDFIRSVRSWIASMFSWFRQARISVARSIKLLQKQVGIRLQPKPHKQPKWEPFSGRLSPRQDVIRGFIRLVEEVESVGVIRKPDQTPSQFAHTLQKSITDSGEDIQAVTDTFLFARYSRRDISRETSLEFTALQKRIIDSLEKYKSSRQE